jgi:hypothetical protein
MSRYFNPKGEVSMPDHYQPKEVHIANMPSAEVRGDSPPSIVRPFITIAQQIGAESSSLPHRLAEVLNHRNVHATQWSHWDQELIAKVSTENQFPAELITSLETSGQSWVDSLLSGISGRPDEMIVFQCLKDVIRRLAAGGHVILVGHGSTFMTRDLPAGLRVRLIAPTNFRIKALAMRFNCPLDEASRRMRRLDKQRSAFFGRFWPGRPLAPDLFAAVLNAAELDEERLVQVIAAMLPFGRC